MYSFHFLNIPTPILLHYTYTNITKSSYIMNSWYYWTGIEYFWAEVVIILNQEYKLFMNQLQKVYM